MTDKRWRAAAKWLRLPIATDWRVEDPNSIECASAGVIGADYAARHIAR